MIHIHKPSFIDNIRLASIIFISSVLLFPSCGTKREEKKRKPNIIYILADDLGYGDLSIYGQQKFVTPHIDKLAMEGVRFTRHYAGTTVCAPSRSSLMTGQHTGHTPIRGNMGWQQEGQYPLPDSAFTVAEMLKGAGYVTGGFGKWGLGFVDTEGSPGNQGFDEFFGYNCQGLAHNYYPEYLWHNDEKVILEGNAGEGRGVYAPELIQEKALEFMERNKDTTFFLYYPSVIPHAELFAPEEYMEKFRGKFLPEKPYRGVDEGERFKKGGYGSQPEPHAAFAAMVTYLDDQVGELMARLKELGLDNNTIVIFTSDNGPHKEGGADPDYFDSNGILRGYKRDLYEGGIRVPMIVRWPGVAKQGVVTDHISAFWDVMPTFADIAGIAPPNGIDGISFVPLLMGNDQPQHDYLYWEFHERGGRRALRQGDWKIVQYDVDKDPQGAFELYNLKNDPSEEHDLAAENPEKVKEMHQLMNEAHTPNEVFPFKGKL